MDNNFTKNLKNLRKTLHMGQSQLADRLGISVKTVSHWETGYCEPSISQLIELAKLFNVSLDYLIL
ncbi:MAG: helix-turn-helix domain-containing protein [Clostridia bacterium]|nr:helix-turn-helix domain-containing protein [Clostridia bacterium]